MQGPRTKETAWAVIQGIEATQMIRQGQVLGLPSGTSKVRRGLSAINRACANPLPQLDIESLNGAWKHP
jgi:hypothetical protein